MRLCNLLWTDNRFSQFSRVLVLCSSVACIAHSQPADDRSVGRDWPWPDPTAIRAASTLEDFGGGGLIDGKFCLCYAVLRDGGSRLSFKRPNYRLTIGIAQHRSKRLM